MLLELSGVCQNCGVEVRVLSLNGELVGACSACDESPMEISRVGGLVYIVSNEHQRGVKIGQTTKPIHQRLKSLNSTGVPGKFDVVAIFPSRKPRQDEQKVHHKLRRHHLEKEHFDVDPVEAALGAYRALNRRDPIFFEDSIERAFSLRLEEARVRMQLRLSGQRG
jgi:hypothetical protein